MNTMSPCTPGPEFDPQGELQTHDRGHFRPALPAEEIADNGVVNPGLGGNAADTAVTDGPSEVHGDATNAIDYRVGRRFVGPSAGTAVRRLTTQATHAENPTATRRRSDVGPALEPSDSSQPVPHGASVSPHAGFYPHEEWLGPALAAQVANYRSPLLTDAEWYPIAPFCREVIAATTMGTHKEPMSYVSVIPMFVHYWHNIHGYPLDAKQLFTVPMVLSYVANGIPADRSEGTRQNYKSKLMRVCEVINPDLVIRVPGRKRTEGVEPYSPSDIVRLRNGMANQATAHLRRNGCLILALSLGAGLSAVDLRYLTVGDIEITGSGIDINAPGDPDVTRSSLVPRKVTMLAQWEWLLLEHLDLEHPDRFAVMPNRAYRTDRNMLANFSEYTQVRNIRLSTQRLRATWLVHHLEIGTPPLVLMNAAGLRSTESFSRYMKHVNAPTWEVQQRYLRGEVA